MSSSEPPLSFPVLLLDEPPEAWNWPAPPYAWPHVVPPEERAGQPCRLETPTGAAVEGFLVKVDPQAATVSFRTTPGSAAVDLPFARFRRLVLTTPLRSVNQPRFPAERAPLAAHSRELRVHAPHGVVAVQTCGHVENELGLFLFTPGPDEYALVREWMPRGAYSHVEVGVSTRDAASRHWIGTPAELLEAADRQRRMSIKPIGQSLLALGMVTPEQLAAVLAQPAHDKPLGERMVQAGFISRADLHTAIAHKMGYPFVDLGRFPIDPAAARKLSLRVAVAHRSLPIMLDQHRVFVAVDRPSRTVQLSALYALANCTLVPVLASKGHILLALSKLSGQDLWHENVAMPTGFYDTSI